MARAACSTRPRRSGAHARIARSAVCSTLSCPAVPIKQTPRSAPAGIPLRSRQSCSAHRCREPAHGAPLVDFIAAVPYRVKRRGRPLEHSRVPLQGRLPLLSHLRPVLFVLSIAACLTSGCRGLQGASERLGAVETAAAQPAPPPPPRSFTLAAVGDVMLDRTVWRRIQENGCESILSQVRDDLQAADVTFANLECPLSTVGPRSPSEWCVFRADPRAVGVLLDGGIDVVALANNHALNSGTEALLQTMQHLEKAGVAYCGAAPQRERSWEPCVFDVGGVLLGFIACTDLSFEHGSWCKVDKAMTEFARHIAEADRACDLLAVSIHWGNEYEKEPTQRQKTVARAAIDAGADLIIGHHPHTLQGIGQYRGVPILYSCGNFVFDQREGERMESAIFHLRWTEGEGWHLRTVPVWIPRARCGPIYPEPERAARIITRLAALSANLGVPVSVEANEGVAVIAAGGTEQSPAPAPQADSSTAAVPRAG
ncbi:MAG: CapA family protein [Armatimonadota bacterium]